MLKLKQLTTTNTAQQISIIAAMDRNAVIGYKNKLPWHLPADLERFYKFIDRKVVVMGRKTFASIGHPLAGCRNIVLSKQLKQTNSPIEVCASLDQVKKATVGVEEIVIIGGAQIYAQFLPYTSQMYLTFIQHEFVGDAYFPVWNKQEWREIERQEFAPDHKNLYYYSVVSLVRK